MRKLIFFIAILFSVCLVQGQNTENTISEGDLLILGEPVTGNYTTINFPRRNFILKRGAIANFNELVGKRVLVKNLKTNRKGETIVSLERADGLNFFRFFPKVNANLVKAIELGELKTTKFKS